MAMTAQSRKEKQGLPLVAIQEKEEIRQHQVALKTL